MVVNPSNRRRGFGKKMVRYASSENPRNWRVRCNSKRDEAHQFYERIGFTNSKTQYVFENRL